MSYPDKYELFDGRPATRRPWEGGIIWEEIFCISVGSLFAKGLITYEEGKILDVECKRIFDQKKPYRACEKEWNNLLRSKNLPGSRWVLK